MIPSVIATDESLAGNVTAGLIVLFQESGKQRADDAEEHRDHA